MDELKLTGNCLKGSRPLLSFDKVGPGNIACTEFHYRYLTVYIMALLVHFVGSKIDSGNLQ